MTWFIYTAISAVKSDTPQSSVGGGRSRMNSFSSPGSKRRSTRCSMAQPARPRRLTPSPYP